MDILERLTQAGVDVAGSLARFNGNKDLYIRFIRKFPNDLNFNLLVQDVNDKKLRDAQMHVHTLKGLSANLGMKELSNACNEMLIKLREDEYDHLDRISSEIQSCYQKMIDAIKE